MANLNLVKFKKAWNSNTSEKVYGEKEYFFNPELMIEGLESCKLNKDGKEIDCTKIFYPTKFIILVGSPDFFFSTCREANVAVCLLQDLYKEGITIKDFIKQNEGLNGI